MTSGQLWVGKSNARDDRNARTRRQVLGLWDGPCLGGILSEVNELETIHCNQSGSDRREGTVRSVLKGQSLLFFH